MTVPTRTPVSPWALIAALCVVVPGSAIAQPEARGTEAPTSRVDDAGPTASLPDAAARVEGLLDRLSASEREADAKRLERLIVEAWHRSGSDTVDLLLQRANVAIKDEDWALSLEYLDTIVELAPGFAEGWNKRATVYYMIKDYERSIADIGQVLAIQPRHFGALSGLGMIFREINQPTRALSVFRRALAVHPHFGEVQSNVDSLAIEVEGRGI